MKRFVSTIMMAIVIILTGCQSQSKSTDKPAEKTEEKTSVKTEEKSAENSTQKVEEEKDRIVIESIKSEALKQNMVGEITDRNITIYLPPSYYTSDKKYPVVYFLHGYMEPPTWVSNIKSTLDKQFKADEGKEFIIVQPDGNSILGGSFYANSPVIGNWEDHIVKEIVNYVDSKYRTIPKVEARGIAGFSMGGYGALNLALRHPDVFSSTYIMSPGAFDKDGLKNAMSTWDTSFKLAYGAAFSPNTTGKYPYANIPEFNGTAEDNKLVADWENGYGNLQAKIDEYKKLNKALTAIKLTCGKSDYYRWIIDGTAYFSKLLNEAGIQHEYETFAGDHYIDPNVEYGKFVEFFSKNLKRE